MNPQRLRTLIKLGSGVVARKPTTAFSSHLGVTSVRWASSNENVPRPGDLSDERFADNLEKPSGSELWTAKNVPGYVNKGLPPAEDPDRLLDGPLYTPRAKLDVTLGPLISPLKWPEYNQRNGRPNAGLPHINMLAGYDPTTYDRIDNPPPGGYPDIPHQWTQLKDPLKYWDQQGRREYGEVLHRYDNLSDEWGVGAEISPWYPLMKTAQVAAVIAGVTLALAWWDPEAHRWFSHKDFPYDGLRVELGGDPDDVTKGNAVRARKYEDHFDPNFRAL
ncbi:hypothetical protein HDU97_010198 [Phlyctochytrium planicorne]|nr:hypothetical protein HDU97_010198 [Phlyctochytrium planicorne]